jgi:hypothetical protein
VIDGGLRVLLRKRLPFVHWQSIETGGTGKGIPDCNGCYQGVEFWVECKVASAWAVRIAPEQIAWLGQRRRAGGRAFVLVRRVTKGGARTPPADELWLYDGSQAASLAFGGLRNGPPALSGWVGGPAKWDWRGLLSLLTHG